MSTADEQKRASALKALEYVEDGMIIGVGTGSTVKHFIDGLGGMKDRIDAAVSSSEQSTAQLKSLGIRVMDLNAAGPLSLYVDGADECDPFNRLIKGGGAALTREKIIAEASAKFICIIDAAKEVEVIPMARSLVGRKIVAMGGQPVWREGVTTDNGNWILDVHNLHIVDPLTLERELNQIPGVVTCGLFARRAADVVISAGSVRKNR
jgi:ribose 5-phosphate isomerase A